MNRFARKNALILVPSNYAESNTLCREISCENHFKRMVTDFVKTIPMVLLTVGYFEMETQRTERNGESEEVGVRVKESERDKNYATERMNEFSRGYSVIDMETPSILFYIFSIIWKDMSECSFCSQYMHSLYLCSYVMLMTVCYIKTARKIFEWNIREFFLGSLSYLARSSCAAYSRADPAWLLFSAFFALFFSFRLYQITQICKSFMWMWKFLLFFAVMLLISTLLLLSKLRKLIERGKSTKIVILVKCWGGSAAIFI